MKACYTSPPQRGIAILGGWGDTIGVGVGTTARLPPAALPPMCTDDRAVTLENIAKKKSKKIQISGRPASPPAGLQAGGGRVAGGRAGGWSCQLHPHWCPPPPTQDCYPTLRVNRAQGLCHMFDPPQRGIAILGGWGGHQWGWSWHDHPAPARPQAWLAGRPAGGADFLIFFVCSKIA